MAPERDQLLTLGEPCDPRLAEPLRVVATLLEGVVLYHPLALDGLLAWAVANSTERILAPLPGADTPTVEIPIMRSGPVHLCSQGFATASHHELRHRHRRTPWHQMARLGSSKITRVDMAVGANKGYRMPYEVQVLKRDEIEWWCVGDAERIRALLRLVRYVGKLRGTGHGRLDPERPWRVEPCEPWGDGFPVVRDGKPMRALPVDWPGLVKPRTAFRTLSYPYFDHTREELVACP